MFVNLDGKYEGMHFFGKVEEPKDGGLNGPPAIRIKVYLEVLEQSPFFILCQRPTKLSNCRVPYEV